MNAAVMDQPERKGPPRGGRQRRAKLDARVRLRTCVACRKSAPPDELVRWVLVPAEGSAGGDVLPDLAASAFGRGAWLHPHVKCMKGAQRGLSRSFKTAVSADSDELGRRLAQAADRRVEGLLSAAQRSRKVAIGSTLVRQELERGRCCLLVVATDARAAATTPWVQQAVVRGLAAAWGTKERLGRVMGRSEVGVVALVDDGLARTLTRSIGLAHLHSPCSVPGDVDGEVSTEVG